MEHIDKLPVIDAELDYMTVEYYPNILYGVRGGVNRYIQLMKPFENEPGKKYPLIIYYQGSAFAEQEMYRWLPFLAGIAKMGYVVASVQGRGFEVARFPAMVEDAKAGLRYMIRHAEEYQADPEQLIIWGDSSGGHTALMVGLSNGLPVLDDGTDSEVEAHIKGIIDFYGVTDPMTMLTLDRSTVIEGIDDIASALMGDDMEKMAGLMKYAKATEYISSERDIPPILIFHGDADVTVPISQSELLYDALKKAGKDAEFYIVKGAPHAGPAFHASSVTEKMDAFIKRVLSR